MSLYYTKNIKNVNFRIEENISEFSFCTLEKQRLNPYSRLSPIKQNQSFFDNPSYMKLLLDITSRPTIRVSEGKDKNGEFQPLKEIHQGTLYRGNWILEYSHLEFAYTFRVKDKTTRRYTKEEVTRYPVIIIDIDDFDGNFEIFKQFSLIPNYLIWNPQKARSLQIGYVLHTPVYKSKNCNFDDYCLFNKKGHELPLSEQHPAYQFYMIFHTLNFLFNGDTNFRLHIAKNPFAATNVGAICWTEQKPYHLFDLVEKLNDIDEKQDDDDEQSIDFNDIINHIKTETIPNIHYKKDDTSRDCILFDELRFSGYEVADIYDESTSPQFQDYLFKIAVRINREYFEIPLTPAQVKKTVRSVVKYCLRKKVKCLYPSHQKRRLDKMSKVINYMLETYGANHRYKKDDRVLLATKFNVSEKTITTYASKIRKEHGTLKDEKSKLLHEIEALRNSVPPVKWSRIAEMLNLTEDNARMMYKRAKKGGEND